MRVYREKALKCAICLYILSSVLLCLSGVLLLIYPGVSLEIVCDVFGVLLLIFGAGKFTGYFSNEKFHLAFQFDLALGILVILFGVLLILHPGKLLSGVWVLIGIFEMIDGAFKFQTALDSRRFGMKKWWLLLAASIACTAFGLFLTWNPAKGSDLFVRLLGISLLVVGIQNLFTALCTVHQGKKATAVPDAFLWADHRGGKEQ